MLLSTEFLGQISMEEKKKIHGAPLSSERLAAQDKAKGKKAANLLRIMYHLYFLNFPWMNGFSGSKTKTKKKTKKKVHKPEI